MGFPDRIEKSKNTLTKKEPRVFLRFLREYFYQSTLSVQVFNIHLLTAPEFNTNINNEFKSELNCHGKTDEHAETAKLYGTPFTKHS